MPIIERMQIKFEKKGWITSTRCFNLSNSVGPGQPNDIGDVYLIQAFFDWILRDGGVFKGGAALSGIDPAKVTGFFDGDTQKMILKFQKGGDWGVEKTLSADGVIHPARLSGRTMRFDRKQMTIVKLNRDAEWGVGPKYGHDHVAAMLDVYPLLKAYTKDTTQGQPSKFRIT